jgi:hypothetical protein
MNDAGVGAWPGLLKKMADKICQRLGLFLASLQVDWVNAPGLPDGIYFQAKIFNLGKFWRVLQSKTLIHFITIYLF